MPDTRVAALVVAAGRGERLGARRPKAYVPLAGRAMLTWSIEALRAVPAVERIVVAVPPREEAPPGTVGVSGGGVRSESVRACLDAAPEADRVVVHDAARPLARPELFEAVLNALDAEPAADGAIAAAAVTDTIKEVDERRVVCATLDRSRLWAAQTPQAFRREALERALAVEPATLAAATDDAWLVERAGGTVRVVEGPADNLKVTNPVDLVIAEALLSARLSL
jgi:2-C-methyl-D-erythritol 4-phosphate cytidylyltransferase